MKKILAFLLAALMLCALFVIPSSAADAYINAKLDANAVELSAPKADGKIGSTEYGVGGPALTYSKNKAQFTCPDDHDDYNNWDFDFYITWDEKNLYMAWNVKSDVHAPLKKGTYNGDGTLASTDWPDPNGENSQLGYMWMFSCVQFIITPAAPQNGKTSYGNNYLEVGLCQLEDGDIGRIAWKYPSGITKEDISLNDWGAAVTRSGKNTIYEVSIPWKMSGIAEAGTDKSFGLSFAVAAQDNYNTKKGMIEWNDAVLGTKQPDKAGVVTLKSNKQIDVSTGNEDKILKEGEKPAEAEGKVQLGIDLINEPLVGEDVALQTDGKTEINTKWAYALLLRPVDGKENVYSIVAKAQGEGEEVKFDDYKKGDLVLGLHSDCTDPAQADNYIGYAEKNAAVNLLAEGDELTLWGVDLKNAKRLYSNAMFYAANVDADAAPSDDSSVEESSEAESSEIEESSEVESKEESKVSTPDSSAPADDEGGFPVWAIILIIVAVVAVVAVVVVIVLKKKK